MPRVSWSPEGAGTHTSVYDVGSSLTGSFPSRKTGNGGDGEETALTLFLTEKTREGRCQAMILGAAPTIYGKMHSTARHSFIIVKNCG